MGTWREVIFQTSGLKTQQPKTVETPKFNARHHHFNVTPFAKARTTVHANHQCSDTSQQYGRTCATAIPRFPKSPQYSKGRESPWGTGLWQWHKTRLLNSEVDTQMAITGIQVNNWKWHVGIDIRESVYLNMTKVTSPTFESDIQEPQIDIGVWLQKKKSLESDIPRIWKWHPMHLKVTSRNREVTLEFVTLHLHSWV